MPPPLADELTSLEDELSDDDAFGLPPAPPIPPPLLVVLAVLLVVELVLEELCEVELWADDACVEDPPLPPVSVDDPHPA
jgi:hypothetical protein